MTEGFGWPVAVSRPIAASAADVWATISTPGILEHCHPFCARNPVHSWPGPESHDEVHYLSGWVYERRFRAWTEGVGFDLDIGGRDEPTSLVEWRIEPADSDRCRLRTVVYPHVLQRVPRFLRWAPHYAFVRPLLRRYLSSVVRGVEWYVTRGEAVAPNQFGRHPWFSQRSR